MWEVDYDSDPSTNAPRPAGITVDSAGNVYVAIGYAIQKWDANGNLLLVISDDSNCAVISQRGATAPCVEYDRGFAAARDVAVDSQGNIYVADYDQSRIIKFDSNGNYILKWGHSGEDAGEFHYLMTISLDDSGNVYASEGTGSPNTHARIQKFDSAGSYLLEWGSRGTGPGQFKEEPLGMDFDSSGNIFVADQTNHRVQKFSPSGAFLAQFGSEGEGPGEFSYPSDVAFDSSGNMYVKSSTQYGSTENRIEVFSPSGGVRGDWADATGGYAVCRCFSYFAIDDSDYLYISDATNSRILKYRLNN